MTTMDILTSEDKDFLAKCEEELKYRYTEKDEEFMKVFNAEQSTPPIIENWWVPQSGGRRNDRRNRRDHPYDRSGNQGRRDQYDRRDNRGYNDYQERNYDRGHGYRNQRPRY